MKKEKLSREYHLYETVECPKCGNKDDIDLIEQKKIREHWYCYKCKKGFYVFKRRPT
jgi:predicted RNA-binding Zn-ribbon protein involved in translation (DUF1610 family)